MTLLESAADQLNEFLDREYEALLAGDLDRIARLADAREASMAALAGSDPENLQDLMAKAHRNQRLLAAAARGIRHVNSRLAVLRDATKGFQTYDSGGQRARGHILPNQLHRRT